MANGYKKVLEKNMDQDVTVDRADADTLEGKVVAVNDEGCTISVKEDADTVEEIFVDFRDVRGVGVVKPDYDVIAH